MLNSITLKKTSLCSFFFSVKSFTGMVCALICLSLLSCTRGLIRESNRFKHNFRQGTADDLFTIQELLGENPVLESEETILLPPSKENPMISRFSPLSSKGGYPNLAFLKKKYPSGLLRIRTVSEGEKATVSFAQENIHIDSKISFINEYEFLDYEILNAKKTEWHKYIAQLLGQLGKARKFKGFPDTTYYILPLFVGNYLVLYKLAPPDKIPYDELPLAGSISDMLAVPLVGYPVKYCIAEAIPDRNYRETGQSEPKCEGIKLQYAEYVKLKLGDKKVFEYEDKPDLFPKDFFTLKESEKNNYNWFYVRTVVKSPENSFVGHQPFVAANLVEFHPTSGKLDVLDAGGYEIKSDDKIRTLFIPVEWTDYQIKRKAENLHPDFSEEPKKNLPYKDLRYFKIKFDSLVQNEIEYTGEKTLKNVFITDNYFSFNVEITDKGTGAYLLKFAFFKKPVNKFKNYVPKKWFEEDSTRFFPTFSEKRRYYKTALDHSHEDHDRFLRTTRFNPKEKEIKWYFSKQTPKTAENQWVRSMGKLALVLLNKALQEAGRDSDHKIKVVLDEKGEDKEVGDIRYNILNLMVTEGNTTSGLLGLGPNVANPITGEVVSATANVWVSHMLNLYIDVVRRYIRFRLYPPAWKMQPFSPVVTASLKKRINKKAPECGNLALKPLGTTAFLHEKIRSVCPEVSDFIITEQQKNNLTYDPENPDLNDKRVIKSCAEKLAFLPILGITLHEILHGFGQRHVFSASVDSENFYTNYTEIKKIFRNLISNETQKLFGNINLAKGTKCHPHPPQYSSVMDYMDLFNPILFVPGKLDIAALRFIYFDKVDLKQKGLSLNMSSDMNEGKNYSQKSILQTATAKGYSREDLKNYKVLCGGEKKFVKETNPNQPLCARFDYGANPLEIVTNIILKTNNYLTNGRNRYDSRKISPSLKKRAYFKKRAGALYKKWKQYRDELLTQEGKSIEDYSFLSTAHITEYQKIMDRGKVTNPDFEMYYDIRRPIFDYFKRLLFIPAKHCVYKQKLNKEEEFHYSAVTLESILDEQKGDYSTYPDNSRQRAINCKSPVIKTWAEKNKRGDLITEVGFLGKTEKYLLRPKPKDLLDENYVFTIWITTIAGDKNHLLDIVLEPEFGDEYYRELHAYMLKGIDLNPYIDESSVEDPDIPRDNLTGRIHLDRVLSYKIEQEISLEISQKNSTKNPMTTEEEIVAKQMQDTGEGIFIKRWDVLESAINRLKDHLTGGELEERFGGESRQLIDIGRTAASIENSKDYPFFIQAYEDFKEHTVVRSLQPVSASFASFIKNHPSTLYNGADSSAVLIPYRDVQTDEPDMNENLPAQLFRRFNEFTDCIEKQKYFGIPCKDMEDKEVWAGILLRHYFPKEE